MELRGRWPDSNGVRPSSPGRTNCGRESANRSVFRPQSDGDCQVPLDKFARVGIEGERGGEHAGLSAGEQRNGPAVEEKWHGLHRDTPWGGTGAWDEHGEEAADGCTCVHLFELSRQRYKYRLRTGDEPGQGGRSRSGVHGPELGDARSDGERRRTLKQVKDEIRGRHGEERRHHEVVGGASNRVETDA